MTHENHDLHHILHAHGYRATYQRLVVLDAVCALHGHPTLADIQAKVTEIDPDIDASTIYRALDVLREVNLIAVSDLGKGGRVYRLAGEANHHHLVCKNCGRILSIDPDLLAPMLKHITEISGFVVSADHLALHGLCAECARAENKR